VALVAALAAVTAAGALARQTSAAAPLSLLSKDGRRVLAVTLVNDQEFVSLDDLAATFQLAVHDEAGAITVSYKSKTIVLTPDQALASVAGRLVSLPAPPARSGRRWLVPVEFISRALAPIYDQRLDLRKPSHLLVVGDLRVPRVVVRYETLGPSPRLTIDATPRAATTVSQQNQRLLIAFDADTIDVSLPIVQPQGLVQAVHVVDPVTIAVELGPRFAAFRASTQATDTTSRTIVDFVTTPAATPAQPPPAQPAQPAPASPAQPASPLPPPAGPAPELPLPAQLTPALRTIVIDPGHGGDDAGVVGAGGTKEKDVALAVAHVLKSIVETRLGVRVLLTRDDDRMVALDDRAALANNNKADLFLSLHANASLRPATAGLQILYAAFEAAAVKAAQDAGGGERLPTFGGGSREIDFLLWDEAQIRWADRSADLARTLQDTMTGRVALGPRPIDRAPMRVLESVNMPAVLVELGFLTNADQEKHLAAVTYQTTLAQAIFDAILKFRDTIGVAP